jgi:hypothetical protein
MFCLPGEGGVALVVCRAELASRYTSKPVYVRSTVRSRRFGSRGLQLVARARAGPSCRSKPRRRVRGGRTVPKTSTSPSSRTPKAARRSCTWPRPPCATSGRRCRERDGVGGNAPHQHRRRLHRQRRARGASGLRQIHESVLQPEATPGTAGPSEPGSRSPTSRRSRRQRPHGAST